MSPGRHPQAMFFLMAITAAAFRCGGSPGAHRTAVRRRTVSMMEEIECDVLIVGGGPAGCTCALYTARADHKVVMLDKNPAVGALAITSLIANYPGVKGDMSGAALLDEMREQAIEYGTDYRRAQVFMVDVEGERKVVYTPDACFKARALVLATGASTRHWGSKRPPGPPHLRELPCRCSGATAVIQG